MIAVLWWCWCAYAWPANTLHVDRGIAQLAMFAAMGTMFLVSLTIPEAFTDLPGGLYAPLMFVGCYFVERAGAARVRLMAETPTWAEGALRRVRRDEGALHRVGCGESPLQYFRVTTAPVGCRGTRLHTPSPREQSGRPHHPNHSRA